MIKACVCVSMVSYKAIACMHDYLCYCNCIQISARWTSFFHSASAIGSSACMASGECLQDSLVLLGTPQQGEILGLPWQFIPKS